MEIQTTKIELLKLILSIENPAILTKIKTLLLDENQDYLVNAQHLISFYLK